MKYDKLRVVDVRPPLPWVGIEITASGQRIRWWPDGSATEVDLPDVSPGDLVRIKSSTVEEMAGRGRPPIGPDIRVRLPVEVRDELQRRADAEGVPLAEIARRILVEACR